MRLFFIDERAWKKKEKVKEKIIRFARGQIKKRKGKRKFEITMSLLIVEFIGTPVIHEREREREKTGVPF